MPSDTSLPGRRILIGFSWLWVGAPLAYGVYELVQKVTQLFTG
ncbi:MFS transporter small subunit [Streptomyces sp. NPDC001450]